MEMRQSVDLRLAQPRETKDLPAKNDLNSSWWMLEICPSEAGRQIRQQRASQGPCSGKWLQATAPMDELLRGLWRPLQKSWQLRGRGSMAKWADCHSSECLSRKPWWVCHAEMSAHRKCITVKWCVIESRDKWTFEGSSGRRMAMALECPQPQDSDTSLPLMSINNWAIFACSFSCCQSFEIFFTAENPIWEQALILRMVAKVLMIWAKLQRGCLYGHFVILRANARDCFHHSIFPHDDKMVPCKSDGMNHIQLH